MVFSTTWQYGYIQIEHVDFDQAFALVARLEFIWIILGITCHIGFEVYQVDAKEYLF